MTTTTMMMKKNSELNKLEQKQFLFEKYLKKQETNFPAQARVAAKLIAEHGMEIWKYVNLGFQLNTLTFFNKPDGQKILGAAKKKMEQSKFETKVVDISDNLVYIPEPPASSVGSRLKNRLIN